MSFPKIPGYTTPASQTSVADVWRRPDGVPEEMWPIDLLSEMQQHPTGWITIAEHVPHGTPGRSGSTRCVLVASEDAPIALEKLQWIGLELGEFSHYTCTLDDESVPMKFEDGLRKTERGARVEFFAQVRHATGASHPQIDVHLPFLWYWDAFQDENGWKYCDSAGHFHELIRWEILEGDGYRLEVRAAEFRRYLYSVDQAAVMQADWDDFVRDQSIDRMENSHKCEWFYFEYVAGSARVCKDRHFYRLIGQYIIGPQRGAKNPQCLEHHQKVEYPEFIYNYDETLGKPLKYICDPKKLGTYFDNVNRVHYLTPVYFKREVLKKYADEPSRYSVSVTALSCLTLWSVPISINSVGLVEVYLGDIGSKIPSVEWSHWIGFNVAPEGEMEKGRFLRDFHGRFAESPDPVGDLRHRVEEVKQESQRVLGFSFFRELDKDLSLQFRNVMGPFGDDPLSLQAPILVLTKVLVDSINIKPLKSYVASQKGMQAIALLEECIETIGGEKEWLGSLRNLQAVRSKTGIAHRKSSDAEAVLERAKISGLKPYPAFLLLVEQLNDSLDKILALLRSMPDNPTS